jgi:hypothetical protein
MLVAALGAAAPVAMAQSEGNFKVGYMDIGPTLGLGGSGGGLAFGGRFERGVKELTSLNNGVLGIEASVDTWSYSHGYSAYSYDFRYISIGLTANYHFKVKDNPKVDPFLGLGLGNSSVSTSYKGAGYSSGVYFIGRAGIRYFFKPRIALYADGGAGASSLNFGVTFGLGGGK